MDVKTLCLGVLTFGDHTGYEIKKHFETAFSHFFAAGYGSIYPALAKLTEEGLVGCTSVEQEKRPDKKVYQLTERGRTTLLDTLASTYPSHRIRSEFFVLLYFADLLGTQELQHLLEQRAHDLTNLVETIDRYEDCDVPGHSFVAGMAKASVEAQLDYLNKHKDSLLDCVKNAQSAA